MNVSLRQLRAFLAVARLRHFRRAAESLHLTQPAISRHIAELEAELDVRLFDRNTREVLPTEAGRYLQGAVERLLEELEGVLAHVHSENERHRGKVHVAAVPTLAGSLMPPCIAACARAYPQLHIQLHEQVQTQVLDSVRGGEVDFGLAIAPVSDDEFDSETIMRDSFYVVCRRDHPLATRKTLNWRSLRGLRLVLLDHDSGSRRLIDQALSAQQVDVEVVQQTGHTHTAFRMVEAGLGISITPGLSLPPPAPLTVLPLTPTLHRAIVLVRRRNRSLSPLAQLIWQQIREMATTFATQRMLTPP